MSTMSNEALPVVLSNLPRRLNDIETFQLPRLRACLGPLDLHRELVEELRGDLDSIKYKLEVAQELYESTSGSQKEAHHAQIDELNTQYTSLKSAFRSAMIESKRNIISHRSRAHELSERNRRYELDSKLDTENGDGEGSSSSKRDTRARSAAEFGMGGDDELQTKTNEVTTALRRTTALMQTELERSVLSVQMLDSSTQTLLSTTTLYDNYTSLLAKSGQLVKIIEKADTIDRLIIFAALLFFLLVVAFIVKRRVIDRTLGVVVGGVGRGVGWYLFGTGKLVRLAFGGRGGGHGRGAGGREMAGLAQEKVGVGSARLDQSGTNDYPIIGSGSAITPQTEQQAQAQAQAQAERKQGQYEQDTIIGVDLGPGHIPHKDHTYDARNNVRGSGEVEVIADDVADRIRPTWVEQVDERAQGRNRDEL